MRKRFATLLLAGVIFATQALAGTPKYIFYFIGDGMGIAPAMASVIYKRDTTGNPELPLMMTFPYAGIVTTYSASSDVTDSAAAGTALATGHKTRNGMLGMDADSIPVTSIATLFKEKGYGVGLVTNAAPDDATPGAFYAHVPHRSMFVDIDRQFIPSQFDFLAGAALNGLTDKEGKSTGLLEAYDEAGIKVIYSPADRDPSKRNVLLQKNPFQASNTGYRLDGREDLNTLPEMTKACLDHLQDVSPKKFFMMVECSNIDHALHSNDAMGAISEIYNLNESLKVAYDFMLRHPKETLIVVTADHDTGGLSVGNAANGYKARFEVLANQKMTKEMFSDVCKQLQQNGNPGGWDAMKALLTDKFGFWNGVKLDKQETADLENLYRKIYEEGFAGEEKSLYNNFSAFAGEVFRLISKKACVGWTTGAHTGNPVGVYAAGNGAENFGRVLDNTEIPKIIKKAAGLK